MLEYLTLLKHELKLEFPFGKKKVKKDIVGSALSLLITLIIAFVFIFFLSTVVNNYTIIKVEKGNGSEIVSRRLYEAGLVESAVEYNQFLVKNGYDRRLSVGNHEIPSGATHEEMARILCGMK